MRQNWGIAAFDPGTTEIPMLTASCPVGEELDALE